MTPFLELRDIVVRYGDFTAVKGVSFGVEEGKMLCLLGPSGCGKTTLLRTIAGFIRPRSGSVLVGQRDFTHLPVHKRGMGLVFQNYALFPHMTVADNVAYGLRMRRRPRTEIQKTVQEMLELVGLAHLSDRLPTELSGGQQQRVSLARALAIRPEVLLLDEPLSNLDAMLRLRMRDEIRRLQLRFGVTSVFVTHDQSECFAIADEVLVLKDGEVVQQGTPEEIFDSPANEFVARFVGYENILHLENKKIAVRAEDVQFAETNSDGVVLDGAVDLITREGRKVIVIVQTAYGEVRAVHDEALHVTAGEGVRICLPRTAQVVVQ